MHAFAPTPTGRVEKRLLFICVILVTCVGFSHQPASQVTVDPSARVEERRQRSVTEDPAVSGEFPNGWLVPNAEKAAVRHAPPEKAGVLQKPAEELEESEIAEFAELFKNTKAPKVLEAELPPGITRAVELQLAGPSGLAGSAQWIGTATALKVTIAVNGSPLVTGTAYRIGANGGGSHLRAQTPVGGHATIAVTNTSNVRVKVRILLVATAR
jgi:hypothetical protein